MPDTRQYNAASTGTGKTHLAVALGRAAILAGYAVLFVQATTLVAALARAQARGGSRTSSPRSGAWSPARWGAEVPP